MARIRTAIQMEDSLSQLIRAMQNQSLWCAIRDLAADGMSTADIVKNAMFAASDDIN